MKPHQYSLDFSQPHHSSKHSGSTYSNEPCISLNPTLYDNFFYHNKFNEPFPTNTDH